MEHTSTIMLTRVMVEALVAYSRLPHLLWSLLAAMFAAMLPGLSIAFSFLQRAAVILVELA